MKIRILFIGLLFFISILCLPLQTFAQAPYDSSHTTPDTNPDVPQNLNTYSQSVLIELSSAISCQLFGIDPTRPDAKCLGVDPKTGKIGFVENGGGAITVMSSMIASLYYIPAGTGDYVHYVAGNFIGNERVLAQDAQAQAGGGYNSLSAFLNIWIVFRNISYLLFVVAFVVVGLGIMLRLPVDNRAVMTIQNQIPKLVLSILFVTFSFAIAGFMIDIMYLLIFLFFGLLSGVSNIDLSSLNPSALQGGNPFTAIGGLGGIGGITNDASAGVGGVLSTLFEGTIGGVVVTIVIGVISAVLAPFTGGWSLLGLVAAPFVGGAFNGQIIGIIGRVIAFLIIGFAIISALFRIWWKLLNAYILLLFDIVLAPFWIVAGVLPGVQLGFGKWFRSIVSHLSVFPTVVVMFLMGRALMDAARAGGGTAFSPPLIGDSLGSNGLAAIIGLGVILATPSVMDNIQKAFGAPQLNTQSIGQALGVGQQVAGNIGGFVTGRIWSTHPRTGAPTGLLNKYLRDRAYGPQPGPRRQPGARGRLADAVYRIFRAGEIPPAPQEPPQQPPPPPPNIPNP